MKNQPYFLVLNNPFGASIDLNAKATQEILKLAASEEPKVTKDKAAAAGPNRSALAKLFTSCIPAITDLQEDLAAIAEQIDGPEKAEVEQFEAAIGLIGEKLLDFCKQKALAPRGAKIASATTPPPIAADTSAGILPGATPAPVPPKA